ncbi:hypothetical protein BJ684DRAFT_16768, partial [Piptocephalis cylindrospora]
ARNILFRSNPGSEGQARVGPIGMTRRMRKRVEGVVEDIIDPIHPHFYPQHLLGGVKESKDRREPILAWKDPLVQGCSNTMLLAEEEEEGDHTGVNEPQVWGIDPPRHNAMSMMPMAEPVAEPMAASITEPIRYRMRKEEEEEEEEEEIRVEESPAASEERLYHRPSMTSTLTDPREEGGEETMIYLGPRDDLPLDRLSYRQSLGDIGSEQVILSDACREGRGDASPVVEQRESSVSTRTTQRTGSSFAYEAMELRDSGAGEEEDDEGGEEEESNDSRVHEPLEDFEEAMGTGKRGHGGGQYQTAWRKCPFMKRP